MLIKSEMQRLLKEKKFDELVSFFTEDYMEILQNYIKKNGGEVKENQTILQLTEEVNKINPNLKGTTQIIKNIVNADNNTYETFFELAIESYKDIREKLA